MKKKSTVATKPDPAFDREAMKSEFWHLKFTNQYGEEEFVFSLGIAMDGICIFLILATESTEKNSKEKRYAVCNLCHDQGKE
jgi:hypothetical protein